ncbi:sirohydrochlorin chelatase [Mycolicibacterium diernhoferi]|uniref:Sirohydrochlorin chelatase n=2 Tax=Mycolicibacterium diernhoferi TaxID=1801 RepID=A0A2A7NRY1_9MYCO|nr:sirohydrochlorin chelatase [Mycolicibacterium diernhoferi]PEG52755.1 sirohydrochlorin chelatase [Mycolicibacterium diernhoferi]QYL25669.1 sirohydrochlorin chelatase [Mycolicibacterium diernhoferi]
MSPVMVLTAHGSADPRSAVTTHAVADTIRRLRPGLDVVVAFCEQTAPNLVDVLREVGDRAVVTPLLLADAFHARTDIPAMITAGGVRARQAEVLGEDDQLVAVLRRRIAEVGVSADDSSVGVIVTAVGSSRPAANARTSTVAPAVAVGTRWAGVTTAFATGPKPSLPEAVRRLQRCGADRVVIAPWFLAHGRITDRVADFAAAQGIPMASPLGSHRLVAETVLDRFDAAVAHRVAA